MHLGLNRPHSKKQDFPAFFSPILFGNHIRRVDMPVNLKQMPFALYLLTLIAGSSPIIPFINISGTGFHDGQRIVTTLSYILILGIEAARITWGEKKAVSLNPALRKYIILFFVAGLVSVFNSENKRMASYEWANFASIYLIVNIIGNELGKGFIRSFKLILFASGVGFGGYLILTMASYTANLMEHQTPDYRDIIGGFDNYRFYNNFQTICFPLLCLLALSRDKYNNRSQITLTGVQQVIKYFGYLMLCCWWMMIFFSRSRGTLFAITFAVVIIYFIDRQSFLVWFKLYITSAILGFSAYLFCFILVPIHFGLIPFGVYFTGDQILPSSIDNGRLPLWRYGFDLFRSHPWFGIGPMHFARYTGDLPSAAHPHNLAIQILCEWGIIALYAATMFITGGLRALKEQLIMFKQKLSRQYIIFTALTISLVAFIVDNAFSGALIMPQIQLWFCLLSGATLGCMRQDLTNRNFDTNIAGSVVRCFYSAALLVIAFLLISGIYPEMLTLKQREINLSGLNIFKHLDEFSPRLWRFGFF
jgi:putative inorganic carbon (hco3(-)) transporter